MTFFSLLNIVIICFNNQLETISLLFRCIIPKTINILQEKDKCFFYQSHPIAHNGIEFDYVNYKLPAHIIGGYTTRYIWKPYSKRLKINVDGALMSDGYKVAKNRYWKNLRAKRMVM